MSGSRPFLPNAERLPALGPQGNFGIASGIRLVPEETREKCPLRSATIDFFNALMAFHKRDCPIFASARAGTAKGPPYTSPQIP